MNNNTPGVKPPETIDLTKCQPGDLLRLRDGGEAVYLERFPANKYPHGIGVVGYGIEHVLDAGWCYEEGAPGSRDVVAIVNPTRAELEEQRRELLAHLRVTTTWMRRWLREQLCDCEDVHVCGWTDRNSECKAAESAIANADVTP